MTILLILLTVVSFIKVKIFQRFEAKIVDCWYTEYVIYNFEYKPTKIERRYFFKVKSLDGQYSEIFESAKEDYYQRVYDMKKGRTMLVVILKKIDLFEKFILLSKRGTSK